MLGKNIFYPFETDNNGLATERLIEKENNIQALEWLGQKIKEVLERRSPKYRMTSN